MSSCVFVAHLPLSVSGHLNTTRRCEGAAIANCLAAAVHRVGTAVNASEEAFEVLT